MIATLDPPRQIPESTLKKWRWVLGIYEGYFKAVEKKGFPLEAEVVNGFINLMVMEGAYAMKSVECIVLPCLKSLNKEITGQEVCPRQWTKIHKFSACLRKLAPKPDGNHCKEPAILQDVVRIIDHMPEVYHDKAREAAAFLFSLNTGARALTTASVLLRDIVKVTASDKEGGLLVQVRLNVTKGTTEWRHGVTISGNPSVKETANTVYWLDEYLKKQFKLSLHSRKQWVLASHANTTLFGLSPDCLRERFIRAAAHCGFPPHMLSYHSLRSGFLCSALITAGSSEDQRRAVLESTAFVAGWKPGGEAQLLYVKECLRRVIVCTRLVKPEPVRSSASAAVEVEESEGVNDSDIILVEESDGETESTSLIEPERERGGDTESSSTSRPMSASDIISGDASRESPCGEALKNKPIIDAVLIDSEAFHSCELIPTPWSPKFLIDSIRQTVVAPFLSHEKPEERKAQSKRCWDRALSTFVSRRADWECQASASYVKDPQYLIPRAKSRTIMNHRCFIGRHLLSALLQSKDVETVTIINEMVAILETDKLISEPIRGKRRQDTNEKELGQVSSEASESGEEDVRDAVLLLKRKLNPQQRRCRRRWTAEEDEKLISLYQLHSEWRKISKEMPHRNEGQCRRHWEVLSKRKIVDPHSLPHQCI